MPRGIRALHDFAPMHLMHAGERLVAYIPISDWLPCSCWCEREVVAVDQALIGVLTFSCRRDDCVAPDGSRTYGLAWRGSTNAGGKVEVGGDLRSATRAMSVDELDKPKFLRGPVRVEVRRLVEERRASREQRDRIGSWDSAMRRNDVMQAWREGKRPFDIALRVHADLTTVLEDLKYLRAKGQLGGRTLKVAS